VWNIMIQSLGFDSYMTKQEAVYAKVLCLRCDCDLSQVKALLL